jgi:hypothetical protein
MSESKDLDKLIHDLNSALSSLSQAIEVIGDNWKSNTELVEKMLPLANDKAKIILEDWNKLKEHIN